jgi:phosphohistidine phosphatase SixA
MRVARFLSNLLREEKHMSRMRLLMMCLVFEFLPVMAFAQPVATQEGWLESMRLGGYVIVLRHGLTSSDPVVDPMSNPAKKSSAERQLSEQGRAQAKAIGEAMRKLKLPVGLVMTSPLQRAADTGRLLGFGEVVTSPDLAEAGPALSEEENGRRAEALRGLLAVYPPADNNLIIVTHKPNITEAFGKDWSDVREGEASIFEPALKGGGYRLIVRIKADEWIGLVQAEH